MVGGTGLYVKAFCEGLDEMPLINPEIRKTIITNYNNDGVEWLKDQVEKNDSLYFLKGEIKNPQRMIRALEVKLSTGKSILEFQANRKEIRNFKIIKIGLELPREHLYKKINNRVDEMMSNGFLIEVKSLFKFKNLNALQTVGYKELFDHLDGLFSLDEAIEKIKINTRHYAKRQLTWFKKDAEVKWINTDYINLNSLSKLISD
jgi:tRNA dimethylallyltransferase